MDPEQVSEFTLQSFLPAAKKIIDIINIVEVKSILI